MLTQWRLLPPLTSTVNNNHNVYTHKVCPDSIQPCNMKKRDIYWRRYKLEETLYIRQWCLSPLQSSTLGPHIVPPITISCPVIFSWISSTVWNLFPFKGDFSWEKSKVAGHQIWAVGGMSHLGDFIFLPKNSAWDVMHELARCHDEAANHQLSIAAAFWIIQIVSAEEC